MRVRSRRFLAVLAASLVASVGSASAGSLYIDTTTTPGSAAFTIDTAGGSGPGWGIPVGTAGFAGSGNLDVTQAGFYSFEYLGAGDSNDANEFFVNNNPVPLFCSQAISGTCAATPLGTTETVFVPAAGEINYKFVADEGGHNISLLNSSTTGNVPAGGNYPASVFTGCVAAGGCISGNPGNAAYLGLTDEAGNLTTGDQDFQDLGVEVKSVPEPASMLLLAAGLAGLGIIRRRHKALDKG